ncbi:MAG: valine--tRNA ligase [Planctomycetota bacterium]
MALPKSYDFAEAEPRWQKAWADEGLFSFEGQKGTGEVFSVDTPPPTVSGSLHIGHLFSYTQAEMIARYKRHRGYRVFYPMGFDDNGLPTERLVEREKEIVGSKMERAEFVKLCLETTERYGAEFSAFFQSLGFSFDWDKCYSTISPLAQRVSQRSFLDLLAKGRVDRRHTPTLWCPQCQTSFAQAEVESKDMPSTFNKVIFKAASGSGEITIATTRPELLPACVSLFVHPDDPRYKAMVGQKFVVPLFGHQIELRADPKADPEKGTGAVMCCTFGDKTDIEWWRLHKLELREALDKAGHMTDIAGAFKGMYLKKARKEILAKLKEDGLLVGQEEISHSVNTHERCGTEQEFLCTPQWYIKLLDHKEKYLKAGESVKWHPEHMGKRYADWVRNLEWDWCISRQRFFGVPFPVWHCSCGGVVAADPAMLPIDPCKTPSPKPCEKCGSKELTGEKDVMDTWATSSVTPQINRLWGEAGAGARQESVKLPMALRPQAHEIIRTWAFYTIVKSVEHEGVVPWKDVMVSGYVTDPNKQKISKSKTKMVEAPPDIIKKFGADLIRYWALGSKLGVDFTYFRDNEGKFSKENVDGGKKLVTKLWNASRLIDERCSAVSGVEGRGGLPLTASTGFAAAGNPPHPSCEVIDLWVIGRFRDMVRRVTDYLEQFEFGVARSEIEKFFFMDFCDNYLEMVKTRLYVEGVNTSKQAAQATLLEIHRDLLVLLAPYIPHVTEEIASHMHPEGGRLIHRAWPQGATLDASVEMSGATAVEMVSMIRRHKTENALSMNAPLLNARFEVPKATMESAKMIDDVVRATCVVSKLEYAEGTELRLVSAEAAKGGGA